MMVSGCRFTKSALSEKSEYIQHKNDAQLRALFQGTG